MAVVNGYATLEDLKEALQVDDDNLDARLEKVIVSASRAVDKVCRRKFYRETTTKVFDGRRRARVDPFSERRISGVHTLAVGDLIAVAALRTDADGDRVFEVEWDPDRDYYLGPTNAPSEPKPYSQVVVDMLNGHQHFPPWPRSIEIEGTWGYAFDYEDPDGENFTAPPDITEATMLLATRYLKRKDAPLGVLETSGLDLVREEIRVHSDPDVKALLKPYRSLLRPA